MDSQKFEKYFVKLDHDFKIVGVDNPDANNETLCSYICKPVKDFLFPDEEVLVESKDSFKIPPIILDPIVKNSLETFYSSPEWIIDEDTKLFYHRTIYSKEKHIVYQNNESGVSIIKDNELYCMDLLDDKSVDVFTHTPAKYHPVNDGNPFYEELKTSDMDKKVFILKGHAVKKIKYKTSVYNTVDSKFGKHVLKSIPCSFIFSSESEANTVSFETVFKTFDYEENEKRIIENIFSTFIDDSIILQSTINNRYFTLPVKYIHFYKDE